MRTPSCTCTSFNPLCVGDWWMTEGSSEGDDFIMFGLCDLGFPELGYVSLNELKSVRMIERDLDLDCQATA